MSVLTEIYKALSGFTPLTDQLAKSVVDPALPAIYEGWASNESVMPYICLSFSFSEGDHFAKREGSLEIDIFTEEDSTKAESIKDAAINCLDLNYLQTEDQGQIRIYNTGDTYLSEEGSGDVHHWNVLFDVIFWRKDFIKTLQERGF